jgi:hypothetical protein
MEQMEQEEYRGSIIHFAIEKPSGSNFWNATGYVVFYKARKLQSLRITGTPDYFTVKKEAREEFLSIAKILIDRQLRT